MTASAPHVRARCEDCDHVYGIPDASHTYRCKSCGGTVRAVPEEEHGGQAAELDTAARFEANEALKQGYGWMNAVTWLFRLGALAYGFVTVLAVLALADSEVPVGPGVTVVALSTVLTAMMLIGALLIDFKPFVWTAIVAVLATVVSAVHLLGPNPMGLALYWSSAWAAFFWLSLVPTWRFRRLIAEHTDLYIMHHASRSTRHAVANHPTEKHERLQQAMRSAALRAWKIAALAVSILVLASLFGSYTVYANLRPKELGVAVTAFEEAWNAGDAEAVEQLFSNAVREHESKRLANVLAGHGWERSLLRLSDGKPRDEEGQRWIDYELDQVTVKTRWAVEGRAWSLVLVELPPPPVEPVLERFQEAWRSSSIDGIVTFFSAKNRERMRESIEDAVQRRSWEPLPEILESATSLDADGATVLTLTVESGDVVARWLLRPDGTWGLVGLKFPRP